MAYGPIDLLAVVLGDAFYGAVYGLAITALCSPFLISGRVRRLFAVLPTPDWRLSYLVFTPLPAVVWMVLAGVVFSGQLTVGWSQPTNPLFAAGINGIVVATVVAAVTWPYLVLRVLPARGRNWYADHSTMTTAALVFVGLSYYLTLLVVPSSVFVIFGTGPAH